ncbi:MAG: hypothetical protein IKG47_03055 [Oscillospiraceae bacterium]|nr:hypothetical protein [Oscillospiraceae bacterium]
MINKLERTFPIAPSQCDSSGRLGIANTFSLFMDIATEHADILGIGLNALAPLNRFWLTVKSKAYFYRMPKLSEIITLSTWPEHPDSRRCNRDYTITSGNELLIAGKTEWAVIDTLSGRLVKVDSVYPDDLIILDDISIKEDYIKFSSDLSDAVVLGKYQVTSNDIDLGGHMNNVAYIRVLPSLFSSKDWQALNIKEIEMWYRSQCFENEELTVIQKNVDSSKEVFYLKSDDSVAFQLRYR